MKNWPKIMFVLFLGCVYISFVSCQRKQLDISSKSGTLGEYITFSENITFPEEKKLTVYTMPLEMLDLKQFSRNITIDDKVKINDMSNEGIIILSGNEEYLQISMNNFALYKKDVTSNDVLTFEKYSALLSAIPKTVSELRYGYLPDEFMLDADKTNVLNEVLSITTSFVDNLNMPVEDHPYRTEYINFEDLKEFPYADGFSGSNLEFYRAFWRFEIDEIPVLSPNAKLVRSGRATGNSILSPYIELLIDSEGIEYASGFDCLTNIESTNVSVEPIAIEVALEVFSDYFEDLILTQESQIEINNICLCYVAMASKEVITLQPAWLIQYKQSGIEQQIAVDMQTGEML